MSPLIGLELRPGLITLLRNKSSSKHLQANTIPSTRPLNSRLLVGESALKTAQVWSKRALRKSQELAPTPFPLALERAPRSACTAKWKTLSSRSKLTSQVPVSTTFKTVLAQRTGDLHHTHLGLAVALIWPTPRQPSSFQPLAPTLLLLTSANRLPSLDLALARGLKWARQS